MFKRLLTFLGKLLLLPVILVLLPIYLLLRKLGWISGAIPPLFQADLDQAKSAEARYLQYSDPTGLDDSITAWERILQHPDFVTADTDFRLTVLNDSATTYWCRYQGKGGLSDLDRALSGWQTAVSQAPAGSPDLPDYLNNLGIGLRKYYARTGDLSNLQTGLEAFQRAELLTPAGSPDLPMFLNSLGNGFQDRYARTGDLTDLQNGLEAFQRAVQLTPAGSPGLPIILNNLGGGLRNRYARMGDQSDLQASIEAFQQAVKLTPASAPDLPMFLNNLSIGLTDRYTDRYADTGDLTDQSDLQTGIEALQRSVQLTPEGSPELPRYLNNLGTGLRDRYARTGDQSDLQTGIKAFQQAVQLTLEGSPDLPGRLNNLGNGFQDRYARTGAPSDLQAGIAAFQQAAQRGLEVAPEESLRSAYNWLHWAFYRQSWNEVTQAHSYAYEAGQRLLKVQLLRTHKESWLKDMQGLASQAAYAFTKLNQLEKAVVTLERGIARLLSEALQRDRANLEQLKTTGHIDLYDRYQEIVDRYHWAQLQQDVDALKTTQADLDKTIEDIRQVPGYEDFLKPVEFDLIQAAAQETPLVYILTTSAGGLALIVKQDEEIKLVWLEELTTIALQEHVANYRHAYEQRQNQTTWFEMLEQTTHWLGQVLWTNKLWQALSGEKQVTLIPVGLLNLFPLHAAWTEEAPGHRCYALDKLTIAYAPNARALTEARQIAQRVTTENLLAVINPRPVHADSLDHSELEVQTIATLLKPAHQHLLPHEQATCEALLNSLPTAKILHFSGHGQANLSEPLQSCLLMAYDEGLTVAELLNLRLTTGIRLATISACETGLPGVQLPDEVVNLPAGLLQVGVASVVASLWSVSNLSTALLMIRFYDNLQQHWHTAGTPAAIAPALQEAQRWLRDLTYDHLKEWIADKKLSLTDDQEADLRRQYRRDPTLFTKPYYWAAFSAVGH
jgi:CHAT domain-containing protein